ncbi:MAG: hypothetical protein ACP5IE_10100 [Infirmifilum sp.]
MSELYPTLLVMIKQALMSAFISRPQVLHTHRSFQGYAGILPYYRVALDSVDAVLRGLEEHRSRINGLREE